MSVDAHLSNLKAEDFRAACVCLTVQRAARRIARLYDQALKPLGLKAGQFSILAALRQDRPVPVTPLAEGLGMDRTTLTKNLRPLERRGLVTSVPSERDGRVRGLVLTREGEMLLEAAVPLWQRAQRKIHDGLGDLSWPQVRSAIDQIAA